jgi:ribosomal protein L7/L12
MIFLVPSSAMTSILQCSHCGAPVKAGSATCAYCHSVIVLPAGASVASNVVAGMPAGVVEALRKENKIEAIRLYREAKKCSLLEAKNTVEALEKQLGLG